jgi:hypothetical protein
MSRRLGKSFVELPDAKLFLRILAERVFQQLQGLSPPISVCDNSLKFKVFCELCDVVRFFDATIHFIFASARIFIISLTLFNECKADGYSTTPLCGHLIPR